MKHFIKAKGLIILVGFIFFAGCSYIPKPADFSKPVEVTSLSDNAWVVDINKALDRPSRYKLSRVEAAKEAQKRGCEYFKTDSLLNEQLSTFKGQRAYRCATEDTESIFITEEVLSLEAL